MSTCTDVPNSSGGRPSPGLAKAVIPSGGLSSGLIVRVPRDGDATAHRADLQVLVWPDGVDELASDYLRHLSIVRRKQPGTVEEYAKILRLAGRFARCRGRSWDGFDDDLLVDWRMDMERRGCDRPRIGTCIKVTFDCLAWCERTGRLRGVVGIYDPMPGIGGSRQYPVSAERGRKGRWRAAVGAGARRSGQSRRHTPTDDEVKALHATLFGTGNKVRNALLLTYAEDTGARVSEMLQLRRTHLPNDTQLQKLMRGGGQWTVPVRRKNGERNGTPTLELRLEIPTVLDCLAYLHGDERRAIVARARGRDPGYDEPDELFISSTTGRPLASDSVTHLATALFRAAGIKRASIHRLRARFITRKVSEAIVAITGGAPDFGSIAVMKQTILTRVLVIAGNVSALSLVPYIDRAVIQHDTALAARRAAIAPPTSEGTKPTLMARADVRMRLTDILRLQEHGDEAEVASALRSFLASVSVDQPENEDELQGI